jgi:type II secretory pathway pseudopilin PulG
MFVRSQGSADQCAEKEPRRKRVGAVLLEVVLALILFVGAAAVISSGLTASVATVERLRFNTHAVNLAVSLLSELEMGRYPLQNAGPTPWETPYQEWTWQIQVESDASETESVVPLRKVEVIIRHESQPIVHRLCQWLPAATGKPSQTHMADRGASVLNSSVGSSVLR